MLTDLPFADWDTFLTWFTETALPYLITFITSGGLATLIYKISKLVSNSNVSKETLNNAKQSLSNCRDDLSTLKNTISQLATLMQSTIETVQNDETKAELQSKLDEIVKANEEKLATQIEEETTTIVVKTKKKKKKKTEEETA